MGSMGYIYYDLLDIKLLWGSAISNSGKTVGYIMELRDIFHGIFGMILWDIDWNYGRVIWENYGRIEWIWLNMVLHGLTWFNMVLYG